MKRNEQCGIPRMSRFADTNKTTELLNLSEVRGGQNCPRHCSQQEGAAAVADGAALGGPLNIEDVAMLLGCSVWTVRQKYLRAGLPHIRASARGRFIFFREQVIDWILERQTKGGR
jgi:hypothetical protein